VKLRICRDKTLASETILYVQITGRDYYAWIEGSPAIGYRPHFSQSLLGEWWQLDRRGSYSRRSYRRLPSLSWASNEPQDSPEQSQDDVIANG
jgi:hypothetical protein